MSTTQLSLLLGKTIAKITRYKDGETPAADRWYGTNEAIDFETTQGEVYRMQHSQDCCESVNVEDIFGNLYDLVNDGPVLLCEETCNSEANGEYGESCTWTFYKFRTLNGDVTIRWLGSSNGYYSESVDFFKVEPAT